MNKDIFRVMILNIAVTLVTVLMQEYDRTQALTDNMVIAIFVAIFELIMLILWLKLGEKHENNRDKTREESKIS